MTRLQGTAILMLLRLPICVMFTDAIEPLSLMQSYILVGALGYIIQIMIQFKIAGLTGKAQNSKSI